MYIVRRYRTVALGLVLTIFLALALCGCEAASKTPPPDEMLVVLEHVRTGYQTEDMDLLTADFDAIMFSEDYTLDTYLATVWTLNEQLGEWRSEVYLGVEDDVYTWRVTFSKRKAKLVLVMDADWKVTGLWFR